MFLFSGSHSGKEKDQGVMEFQTLLDKAAKGMVVRTDSRKIQSDECFVAMPGTAVRGLDYIPNALDNGARYIVAPESARDLVAPVVEHKAVAVYVENPAVALGELARAYFHVMDRDLKLVGITGTNGKTTTSYILEHLLVSSGLKVGVLGTVNYRWPGFAMDAPLTTPDCWMIHELLFNMKKADVDVAIMEVSSHALDQYRVAGLDFDAAVFTNLTQDHLDYHGSMEEYFRAKSLLFKDYLRPGKPGVLNYNDPYGRRLLTECEDGIGYGIGDTSLVEHEVGNRQLVSGRIMSMTGQGMELETSYKGKSWVIHSPLVGSFNAMNLLAAQAVGLQLGLNCKDMRKLSTFPGVPGRLERVMNDRQLDIFVDFAHTPDALENVQHTLKGLNFKRLITVFGCGGDRDKAKRPLMAESAARYADVAVLTSDNPRTEEPEAIMDDARPGLARAKHVLEHPNRQAAITMAVAEMEPGDALLIAGKGHEDYQVIGTTKRHFSDVEAALKAIEEVYS
ncbi:MULTISPECIES: UDP-N-acetylmuramoyl-L-alanyl-D-glutamate--2,6-diaminopimelate ligase [unclassified Pseudodesulfovibrio]|uniref:UDP-N-acetylmuramoyl-L-alanyl-D-glutamate--2, 6-diaminopimelate ligase n=1 Tax=unclassified Pseudodesulfovibrio TaxID=2661612 RepID=UPI000FEBC6C6|nr:MULTISPECIES: UDP-N-acetylmuramoyl-L-alanyl-D-glutamate--2,6-diaminopimelate ligase [unclassified Pseudodesulfovibrio]MCJ2164897.1 UDP-N-acetylmuramoyl-L-alanyl-D-glutamate--2,6-diaminopimelate ligase [Pseudodesulfovibrio sp. S3-i]RWU03847.1 UDP-N-acetylmuramoyl-L-alanyl-D-glutamate--2,6-diaminopimelate ligase [Pseudodesulfovibrio sp. S3]